MKTDESEAAILDAARKVPMANERPITWTVQLHDDATTRQPLPDWLSRPVEKSVTWWSSENRKWQAKIDARAELGKVLPAKAKMKYDAFVNEKSVLHLLFSKKTRKQVLKLQSIKDLEKMKKFVQRGAHHVQWSIIAGYQRRQWWSKALSTGEEWSNHSWRPTWTSRVHRYGWCRQLSCWVVECQ